jgi:hypothetical protein
MLITECGRRVKTRPSAPAKPAYFSTGLDTEHGAVAIDAPRDRNGSLEPQIVRKRQRRFEGFDEKILAIYGRGCQQSGEERRRAVCGRTACTVRSGGGRQPGQSATAVRPRRLPPTYHPPRKRKNLVLGAFPERETEHVGVAE